MSTKTDYEKERDFRISQNNAVLEALGVPQIASAVKASMGEGRKSKKVVENDNDDVEYSPNLEHVKKKTKTKRTTQPISGCDKVCIVI